MQENQVIYADVLFIINFSMDFLVIYTVAKILKLTRKTFYMVLASCVGAIFSVMSLLLQNNTVTIVLNIVFSVVICFISFRKVSYKTFIKCIVLFYGLSYLLGGALTSVYSAVNKLRKNALINMDSNIRYSEMPLWVFAVITILCIILSYVTGKIFVRSNDVKKAEIMLEYNGKKIKLDCLADSGNLLCEPISALPVIIVSYEKIKEMIPYEMQKIFEEGLGGDDYEAMKKIKIIPVHTVNNEGILLGFVCDKLYIRENGKSRFTEKKAVIAPDKNEKYGNYSGILPLSLID